MIKQRRELEVMLHEFKCSNCGKIFNLTGKVLSYCIGGVYCSDCYNECFEKVR